MPRNRPQSSLAEASTQTERVRHLCFLVWAVIGIVLLAGAVGYVLGQVSTALIIIGIAAFIVFILRVPVAWLEARRVGRLWGSLVAYLLGLLIVSLVLFIFIPVIWEQILELVKLMPGYITEATTAFNDFYQKYSYLLEDSNIQQMVSSAATELSGWAGNLVSQSAQGVITLGTGVVTSVIVLTMALIVGFWVLKDLPKIGRELRVVIGPRYEEGALFIASVLSRAFGGYLRGITVAGLCTGTIAGIGYYLVGLPYPAVFGLLTGLMNFLPYVGPWIAGTITALIGLFVSPITALLAILVTVIAQQFTDNFITPRVMSSTVELHPAVILIGIFAGGALGGIPGLIIAAPLLSSIKVIFVHYFEKRTGRHLGDEAGALFKSHRARYEGENGEGGSASATAPAPVTANEADYEADDASTTAPAPANAAAGALTTSTTAAAPVNANADATATAPANEAAAASTNEAAASSATPQAAAPTTSTTAAPAPDPAAASVDPLKEHREK
jgi:predicted PurR-regulated permease PerM